MIIAQILNKDMLVTNLNIKTIYQVLLGYHTINGQIRPTVGTCVQEHVIAVYLHNKREYLINTGVQLRLTSRRHLVLCRYVIILVDIPYRLGATALIRAIRELTMLRVKEILQTISIKGLSIIDKH